MRFTNRTCIVVTVGAAMGAQEFQSCKAKLSDHLKQTGAAVGPQDLEGQFPGAASDAGKASRSVGLAKTPAKEDAMRTVVLLSSWGTS
ncbi:hypothetical protein Nepgr_007510 [Nepenthes gracilis]|uniref:Uncharacterized protein n=1 Tax=Nepenthes gracilis TaxID=150966 RepID=A0AAD3XII2_NEPGR|nr:hypothetical protein Nepgr_007510 [Nepenthes gracilis]